MNGLSDRPLAAAPRRERRCRLRDVIDALPEMAWIANALGEVVHVNREWSGAGPARRDAEANGIPLRDGTGRILWWCGIGHGAPGSTDARPPASAAAGFPDVEIAVDPGIDPLLRAAVEARDMPGGLAGLYSRSLCLAILARLGNGRVVEARPARRPAMALPKWRLARVAAHVEEHIGEPIRLADLAGAAGLTRMHFAAQFRAAMGLSPHAYVVRRRVRHAQELLRDPRARLADVALSVGFQTQSHFTTAFRRCVGDTPNQWRRRDGGLAAASGD